MSAENVAHLGDRRNLTSLKSRSEERRPGRQRRVRRGAEEEAGKTRKAGNQVSE